MTKGQKEEINHKTHIVVKGARVHNLKNIDVAIPRNKLVVITGLSGSGKSSLAFDTLYAEGQRRYVESLSSYARQFMGRFDKPDVDSIKGISPAIAIEQKVISRNPRSTVGTTTEIYDYLKLLFARVGKTYSPISGDLVKKDNVTDVVNFVNSFEKGTKVMILTKVIPPEGRGIEKHLLLLLDQGYTKVKLGDTTEKIEQILQSNNAYKGDIYLIIDRLSVDKESEENNARIGDSAQSAFIEGVGECTVEVIEKGKTSSKLFSNKFEADGILFEEPSLNFFSFNNPLGACKACEGFGMVLGIDPDLVIPNKNLSIFENAIVCWKGDVMGLWKNELVDNASELDFPIHRPIHELTKEQMELLWTGNKFFSGLNAFFSHVESQVYKIQYRVMLSRYRGKTKCPSCNGSRIRKETNNVLVGGKTLSEIVNMSIKNARIFFNSIELTEQEQTIGSRLFIEIKNRLSFLSDVGLDYLSINRPSNTLSGGESQRINLATSLGSSLVGSMYILDEPSIGLHPRDTKRLITVLESLRDLGNTVIVVEHEEEIMQAADEIIDIGPMAGEFGGEVIFQGNHEDILTEEDSLTALYLTGRKVIEVPGIRRKWNDSITFSGARENNLKNIDVEIPLNALTCITGVSGSGKSSLVKKIIYPALKKNFGGYGDKTGEFSGFTGSINQIQAVEYIDQNPIGKSSRSNPTTYVKAYDDIRSLFAEQQLSKINGFKSKHFSFNVEGGRCDECEGEGEINIEMQFMADVKVPCDNCQGKRFKDEVLEVRYHEKNIYDILMMSVDEAMTFFSQGNRTVEKRITEKIRPLQEVGLGYVKLGQSSSTLSGGEAQRIKLASFLVKGSNALKTLFVFDEPTTGLHFHDIEKLLKALNSLIEQGHTVLVVEHNTEVIKSADWVLDLGPEGGDEGGHLIFSGTPEDLVNCKGSYTAEFLKGRV